MAEFEIEWNVMQKVIQLVNFIINLFPALTKIYISFQIHSCEDILTMQLMRDPLVVSMRAPAANHVAALSITSEKSLSRILSTSTWISSVYLLCVTTDTFISTEVW